MCALCHLVSIPKAEYSLFGTTEDRAGMYRDRLMVTLQRLLRSGMFTARGLGTAGTVRGSSTDGDNVKHEVTASPLLSLGHILSPIYTSRRIYTTHVPCLFYSCRRCPHFWDAVVRRFYLGTSRRQVLRNYTAPHHNIALHIISYHMALIILYHSIQFHSIP